MLIRRRLALAIIGFTIPFILNCILIATTALMMIHDESPILIVASITLCLCVTLIVIKAVFHLTTECSGPLETGPARRLTARDANRQREENIPMTTTTETAQSGAPSGASSPALSVPSRPLSPVPPPSPPSPPSPPPTPAPRVIYAKAVRDRYYYISDV